MRDFIVVVGLPVSQATYYTFLCDIKSIHITGRKTNSQAGESLYPRLSIFNFHLSYYFPGYTNEIQLPNPVLALYNSPSLTFTLIEREGGRRTQELTEEGTRRAGSTSSKGSTGSTASAIRTASTAHFTTSYARYGMDPCYICTGIYPWVWIWYGIRSSPLRGWNFELVGRRVELAGARRRRPK